MKNFLIYDKNKSVLYKNHINIFNIKNYELFELENYDFSWQKENEIIKKILTLKHEEDFCVSIRSFFIKNGIDEAVDFFKKFLNQFELNWDIILLDFKDERVWESQKPLNFPLFFNKWGKINDFISQNMLKKLINFPYAIDKSDKKKPSFNYSNLDNNLLIFNHKNIAKILETIDLNNGKDLILNIMNNKLKLDIFFTPSSISFGDKTSINFNLPYRPIIEIVLPVKDEIIYSPEYLCKINVHKSLIATLDEQEDFFKNFKIYINGELKNYFKYYFAWKKNDYILKNNMVEINFNLYPELVYYFSKLKILQKKDINFSISYNCPISKEKIVVKTKFVLQNIKEIDVIKNEIKKKEDLKTSTINAFWQ